MTETSAPCGACDHPLSSHSFLLPCTEDGCDCVDYVKPDGEVWNVDSATDYFGSVLPGSQTLVNVHSATQCMGRACCLHNPSDHALRDAPLQWRGDIGIMERVCEHGIGHPDPDDLAYRNSVRKPGYSADSGVHGCDGCCHRRG